MTKEKDPRTVTLKGVRLPFTSKIKEKGKSSADSDKEKHDVTILLESTGPYAKYFEENKKKVVAALKAAGEKAWKKEMAYKDIQEDDPKRMCFRKGEKFKNKDGQVYAGFEGNYAFGASGPSGGQRRPILKDKYKRDVAEADINDVIYPGTYGDVIVSFFGTDKGGSRGIFSTCELIRSHQMGERMAGGYMFDEDDLDELDDLGDPDDLDDMAPSTSSKKAPSLDDDDI